MKPPVFVSICTLQRRSWLESQTIHNFSDLSLAAVGSFFSYNWNCPAAWMTKSSLPVSWEEEVRVPTYEVRVFQDLAGGEGSPPQRTHQNPRGSFYWGWESFPRAALLPAASRSQLCPDCPKNACGLPSWSCPYSRPEITPSAAFKARILRMYSFTHLISHSLASILSLWTLKPSPHGHGHQWFCLHVVKSSKTAHCFH